MPESWVEKTSLNKKMSHRVAPPPPINPEFNPSAPPASPQRVPVPQRTRLSHFSSEDRANLCEFAQYLGFDLKAFPFLLPIVIEAINSPTPPNWEQHTDDNGNMFFHNRAINRSVWEHPTDRFYMHCISEELKLATTKTKSKSCNIS